MTETRRDSERTRRQILTEATSEFAERGFAGARVDDIAARTATTKRMIYYYFGSKAGLFSAVLETQLNGMEFDPPAAPWSDPAGAIGWLVRGVLEDAERHPERARLLAIANIHHGAHLTGAAHASQAYRATISWLTQVLQDGARQGVFRAGVDPADLVTVIQAVGQYRMTHHSSTQILEDVDLLDPEARQRQEDLLTGMVLSYLAPSSTAAAPHQLR